MVGMGGSHKGCRVYLITPPTFDPGVPGWSVTARTTDYSRTRRPQTVTGTGVDETAALRNLDDRLRGVPQPNGSRMAERERRLRLAYLEGAEEWSRDRARTDRGRAGGHRPAVPLTGREATRLVMIRAYPVGSASLTLLPPPKSVVAQRARKVEATTGFEPVNRGFAGLPVASAGVRECSVCARRAF